MLMGDCNSKGNRPWIRFTRNEFDFFRSAVILNHILCALQNKTSILPVSIGSIELAVNANDKFTSVCVQKSNFKINLGLSSWEMMINSKEMIELKLSDCELPCHNAKEHFQYLLDLSGRHLAERGYSTVDSVIKCKNSDQLIKEVIGNVESQFPKLG